MLRGLGNAAMVTALCAGLSGCALARLAGDAPAPNTYDLVTPTAASFTPAKRSAVQLAVAEPVAVRVLAGDNILVKPDPAAVTYLGNAVWSDKLPRLLQARLIETIERTAAFRGVGDGRERIETDVEMLTQIRAFQIDTDGTRNTATVDLFVKLVDARSGRVLSSGTFAESVAVVSIDAASAVDGLNRAIQVVLPEIALWAGRIAAQR